MPWIHIDDEVGILLWALDNDAVSGIVNGTAPNPVDQQGLIEGARPGAQPAGGAAAPRLRRSTSNSAASSARCCAAARKRCRGGPQELGYEFKFPELDAALQRPRR